MGSLIAGVPVRQCCVQCHDKHLCSRQRETLVWWGAQCAGAGDGQSRTSWRLAARDGDRIGSLHHGGECLLSLCTYCVSTLCSVGIQIYTTRAGKDIMEAKQVSKWQAVVISVILIVLFCSRAIYNIIAVQFPQYLPTFGYARVFSSDMVCVCVFVRTCVDVGMYIWMFLGSWYREPFC